jgi:hypothetical protein
MVGDPVDEESLGNVGGGDDALERVDDDEPEDPPDGAAGLLTGADPLDAGFAIFEVLQQNFENA